MGATEVPASGEEAGVEAACDTDDFAEVGGGGAGSLPAGVSEAGAEDAWEAEADPVADALIGAVSLLGAASVGDCWEAMTEDLLTVHS